MGTKKIDVIQSAQITSLEADVLELRTKLNLAVTDAIAISAKLNTLIDDLNDMNDVVMKGYTPPQNPTNNLGILQSMDVYKDAMTDHLESFLGRWGAENGTWSGGGTGDWSACQVDGPWLTGTEWQTYPTEVLIGHGTGGATWPTSAKHDSPEPYDVEMFNYNGSQYAALHPFMVEHPPALLMDCGSNSGSNRTGGSSGSNSGTAGYGSPVVDGTGQSGNTSHSADAEDSVVVASYVSEKVKMVSINKASANRAKKLARKTLNRLRK